MSTGTVVTWITLVVFVLTRTCISLIQDSIVFVYSVALYSRKLQDSTRDELGIDLVYIFTVNWYCRIWGISRVVISFLVYDLTCTLIFFILFHMQ